MVDQADPKALWRGCSAERPLTEAERMAVVAKDARESGGSVCAWVTYGASFAVKMSTREALVLLKRRAAYGVADEVGRLPEGAPVATSDDDDLQDVRALLLRDECPAVRARAYDGRHDRHLTGRILVGLLQNEHDPQVLRAVVKDPDRVRVLSSEAEGEALLFRWLDHADVVETLTDTFQTMRSRGMLRTDALRRLDALAQAKRHGVEDRIRREDRTTRLVFCRTSPEALFEVLDALAVQTTADKAAGGSEAAENDLVAAGFLEEVPWGLYPGERGAVVGFPADVAAEVLCARFTASGCFGCSEELKNFVAPCWGELRHLRTAADEGLRRAVLLSRLATDPRKAVRLVCAGALRRGDNADMEVAAALLGDPTEDVRIGVLSRGLALGVGEAAGSNLSSDSGSMMDAALNRWFERLCRAGASAEKLAALETVFSHPALAAQVEKLLVDDNFEVANAYGERVLSLVRVARGIALGVKGIRQADLEADEPDALLSKWFGLGASEEGDEERSLRHLRHDALTALRLMRTRVDWAALTNWLDPA